MIRMKLLLYYFITFFFHRGGTFRVVLAKLGDLRSLIPRSVHTMALTATATSSDRIAVSRTLGLRCPNVLTRSPAKPNIAYAVGNFTNVSTTFEVFFPKTIIYGQTFSKCGDIYTYLHHKHGHGFKVMLLINQNLDWWMCPLV